MRYEYLTHEDIREKLISLGWKDKSGLKSPEKKPFIEEILKESIKRLNAQEFRLKALTAKEEDKVLQKTIEKLEQEMVPVKVLDWL